MTNPVHKCAKYLVTRLPLYSSETEEAKKQTEVYFRAGLQILTNTSNIWLASPNFTTAVQTQIMAAIEGSTLDEQGMVNLVLQHLLKDGDWCKRTEHEDNQLLSNSRCQITKLVWLFRIGTTTLATMTSDHNPETPAEMVTNLWKARTRNVNVQGQDQVFRQFAVNLKRWGRMAEHRNVLVDTTDHNAIIDWCADKLLIDDYPRNDLDRATLIRGLRTLQHMNTVWSENDKLIDTLRDQIVHELDMLPTTSRSDLSYLIRVMINTTNTSWAQYDRDMVSVGSCAVSALLWALMVGPLGFEKGWREGKSAVETLKAAEDDMESGVYYGAPMRPRFEEVAERLRGTCG